MFFTTRLPLGKQNTNKSRIEPAEHKSAINPIIPVNSLLKLINFVLRNS